jgi:integrase
VHRQFLKRFAKSARPKYGDTNKGFTEPEVQAFFKAVDNPKLRLLFSFQAQLGLRIGEAVRINIKDMDFQTRELTIKTEKTRVTNTLLLPVPLFRLALEHIRANESKIEASGGFLFFKEDGKYSHRDEQWLSSDYVRNEFRRYVQMIDLNQAYEMSDETIYSRTPRQLHRLTTHSLRHYAITHFAKSTNGNVVLTSRFARHSNPIITMRYISKDNEELFKNINFAFDKTKIETIKQIITSKSFTTR